MKNLPEIDPCEPLQLIRNQEQELEIQKREEEEFYKELDSDTVRGSKVFNWKTKKLEESPDVYKKGTRVYIAKADDGSVIVNDKGNFGLCDMGCLRTHYNIRYNPETGEVLERRRMTTEEMVEFLKKEESKAKQVELKEYPDIIETMRKCKDEFYQHAKEVLEQVGHIPVVPLKRYVELLEEYGDTNPEPNLSCYDMELPDQLIANNTLEYPVDIGECCGSETYYKPCGAIYVCHPSHYYHSYCTLQGQANAVAEDTGETGKRLYPAKGLEEAKQIADERKMFTIKAVDKEDPENQTKDFVVAYKKNGEWIEVENDE